MKKLTTLAIFGCALLLAACSPKAATDSKSASGTSSSNSSPPNGPVAIPVANPTAPPENTGDPTTIAVLPTTMGTRNFDQINATMESVTGVSGNSNVISRFKSLSTQLPSDNDIKSFSFSAQNAVTVLAAEYCTALIQNKNNMYANQRAAAIGNINITANPATVFNTATTMAVAQSLVMKFWGSSYANNANAATAVQSVAALINTLVANQTSTQNTVIGACTAVLASAPVSTY